MSEETSISDLLPLVAAALNDKAAADAAKELAAAREERDIPRKVEVIRSLNNGGDEDEDEDVVVYSSGMFEDGQYARNTNLWDVTLEQNSSNICSLANLRDCHICVGGGFPVASLDHTLPNNATFEGWINGEDRRQGISGDACEVSFCFCPHTIWLVILIHGWPREAWEAVIQEDDYDQDDQHVVHFLVENVAEQYPDATVEFKTVAFVAGNIHGALKRLLPPKRKEEVRADRDRRNAENDPEIDALYDFVARAMRERGNEANVALFAPQLNSIMGFLSAMGVDRLGVNDELIIVAIATHEQLGDEGLRAIFAQFRPDEDAENEDDEQQDEADNEYEA